MLHLRQMYSELGGRFRSPDSTHLMCRYILELPFDLKPEALLVLLRHV